MAVERRRWVSELRAKSLSSLPDYDAVSGVRREVTRGGGSGRRGSGRGTCWEEIIGRSSMQSRTS